MRKKNCHTCALVSALSGRGTALGEVVNSVVINEASNGASSDEKPLLEGSECFIPACVKAEAVRVVGVEAPDDAGDTAAGAIVVCRLVCRCIRRFESRMQKQINSMV